jgi:hypothetical protein
MTNLLYRSSSLTFDILLSHLLFGETRNQALLKEWAQGFPAKTFKIQIQTTKTRDRWDFDFHLL